MESERANREAPFSMGPAGAGLAARGETHNRTHVVLGVQGRGIVFSLIQAAFSWLFLLTTI